jgi:hypothetical protein
MRAMECAEGRRSWAHVAKLLALLQSILAAAPARTLSPTRRLRDMKDLSPGKSLKQIAFGSHRDRHREPRIKSGGKLSRSHRAPPRPPELRPAVLAMIIPSERRSL